MLPAKAVAPGIQHQQPKFTMVGGIPRPGVVVAGGGLHGAGAPRSVLDPSKAASAAGSGMAVPTVAKPPDFTEEEANYIRKMSRENPVPKACPVFRFGFGGKVVTSFPSRIPGGGGGFVKRPGPVRVFNRLMDIVDPTISAAQGSSRESMYRYKLDDVSTFVDMIKGFPSAHGNAGPLTVSAGAKVRPPTGGPADDSVSAPLQTVTQIKQFINNQVAKLEQTRSALQQAGDEASPSRDSSTESHEGFVIVPETSSSAPVPVPAPVPKDDSVNTELATSTSPDSDPASAAKFDTEKKTEGDAEAEFKNGVGDKEECKSDPNPDDEVKTEAEIEANPEVETKTEEMIEEKTDTEEAKTEAKALFGTKPAAIAVSTSAPSTASVTPTSVPSVKLSSTSSGGCTASIVKRLDMEIRMWNLLKLTLDFGGSTQSETGAKTDGSPEAKIVHVISAAMGVLAAPSASGGPVGKSLMQMSMNSPVPTTAKSMRSDPMFLQSPASGGSCIDTAVMSSYLSYLRSEGVTCSTAALTGRDSSVSNSLQQTSVATAFAHIENLLLHGQHEEAVAIAVSTQQWGLAMLISSCVGKTKAGVDLYQNTVQQFSKTFFPVASPMHVLALTYSNQCSTDLYTLGTDAGPTQVALEELRSNAELWSRHFCAVMANKSTSWKNCLRRLGDGMLTRTVADVQVAAKTNPVVITNNAYYVGFATVLQPTLRPMCVYVSVLTLRVVLLLYSLLFGRILLTSAVANCPPHPRARPSRNLVPLRRLAAAPATKALRRLPPSTPSSAATRLPARCAHRMRYCNSFCAVRHAPSVACACVRSSSISRSSMMTTRHTLHR